MCGNLQHLADLFASIRRNAKEIRESERGVRAGQPGGEDSSKNRG
jgi:hypothetical protein